MSNAEPLTASPPGEENKITRDLLLIAGVVVLGIIMAILDTTVTNVALPTFQRVFSVSSYSSVAWTVTGYTLALAAIIPVTGWAADRFGTKRLYMTAIALFLLGSLLCSTAQSLPMLVTFRVLQGLGGGMLMPLGITILTQAAGPQRMGRLMAILGIPILLGPILGPILGGWLIDAASWRWIFLINLPIGAIALLSAARVLPKDNPHPSEKFDAIGMALMSPGLALTLYGVSSIPGAGTVVAGKVLIPGILGLLLITAFVFWSFKPEHPLLDLHLFKDRNLTVAVITLFLFMAAFFGALLLLPTYYQEVRGKDVLDAGLLVAPQGLGAMLTMPIAGRLADRLPIGRITPFGLLFILVGLVGVMTAIGSQAPIWHIEVFLFVMGLGMGATMMPLFTAALRSLPARYTARGSTLINVIQQTASSIGVAAISVVLTNNLKHYPAVVASQNIGEAKLAHKQPSPGALQKAQELGSSFASVVAKNMSGAFHDTYIVAIALLLITLIPVSMLPKRHADEMPDHSPLAGPEDELLSGPAEPVFMH